MLYVSNPESQVLAAALERFIAEQEGLNHSAEEIETAKRVLKRVNLQDLGWNAELANAAEAEGWCISDTGGLLQLQRLDERERFTDDFEAIGYVVTQAEMGSELHGIALGVTLSPQWHGTGPVAGRPRKELAIIESRPAAEE